MIRKLTAMLLALVMVTGLCGSAAADVPGQDPAAWKAKITADIDDMFSPGLKAVLSMTAINAAVSQEISALSPGDLEAKSAAELEAGIIKKIDALVRSQLAGYIAAQLDKVIPQAVQALDTGNSLKSLVTQAVGALTREELKTASPETIVKKVRDQVEPFYRDLLARYIESEIMKLVPAEVRGQIKTELHQKVVQETAGLNWEDVERKGMLLVVAGITEKLQPFIAGKLQEYVTQALNKALPASVQDLVPGGLDSLIADQIQSGLEDKVRQKLQAASGEDDGKSEELFAPKGIKTSYQNIDTDKVWTLMFDQDIDPLTVPVGLRVSSDASGLVATEMVTTTSPRVISFKKTGGWEPEATYYVYISQALKSKSGQALARPVKFKFTVQKKPSADNLIDQAQTLLSANKPQEAAELAKKAEEENPQDYRAHSLLGQALMSFDPDAAIAEFKKALDIDPKAMGTALLLKLAEQVKNTAQPSAPDSKDETPADATDVMSLRFAY
jgi:hypothetical protein